MKNPFVFGMASIILLFVGVLFYIYPQIVRKYDRRMTRFIKNEEEYIYTIKFFGIIIIFFALSAGLIFIFGLIF